jgi:hypothetical protein
MRFDRGADMRVHFEYALVEQTAIYPKRVNDVETFPLRMDTELLPNSANGEKSGDRLASASNEDSAQ